jgi:hypothetical protein
MYALPHATLGTQTLRPHTTTLCAMIQVIYLDCVKDDDWAHLKELADVVRAHFKEAGFLLEADKEFTPHITIAKTSKLNHGGRPPWKRQWRGGKRNTRGFDSPPSRDGAECHAAGGQQRSGVAQGRGEGCTDPGVDDAATEVCVEAAAPLLEEQVEPASAALQANEQVQLDQGQSARLDYRRIDPQAYAAHLDIDCGGVQLGEIELCAMAGRLPGSYYPVLAALPLSPLTDEEVMAGDAIAQVEKCMHE